MNAICIAFTGAGTYGHNRFEIPLTRGQIAVVDSCDADLAGFKWCALKQTCKPHFPFYATRHVRLANGKRTVENLHRVILSRILGRPLISGERVDHVSGDGLLNTRANLRLATPSQNAANQGKRRNNTSGLKGVTFNKDKGKWEAAIGASGKRKYLGCYANVIDAAIAYDRAAYELHGEYANCNWPRFACGLGGK